MMFFLQHQWKAFWRSKSTGRSLATRIVMAVLVLYLIANFLVLGLFLGELLESAFPYQSTLVSFTALLLYYFLCDLLLRFQFQELPTLSVRPYLHLRLRRRQLVNYLCVSSLWSVFNLLPFILVLPFLLRVVLPYQPAAVFWGLLLCIIGLTTFNHFFSLWFKRKANLNGWYLLSLVLVLASLALADFYWELFSLSEVSQFLFSRLLSAPLWCVPVVLAGIAMFSVNYRFLKENLYLDELKGRPAEAAGTGNMRFFNGFGLPGMLAQMELKLILRNKRPRSVLNISAFSLFYGLLFFTNPAYNQGYGFKVFASVFMTGIFIANYGQFMFSWQSACFDGLMVSKMKARDFFASKVLIFFLFAGLALLLCIPYVYFGLDVLGVLIAVFLWNIGVNSFLVLYFANYNYKRIDLSKAATFNWEGVGAMQWLMSAPLLFGPSLIYGIFSLAGAPVAGIMAIGGIGLIFILGRNLWIGYLAEKFQQQRYKISEGFRHE